MSHVGEQGVAEGGDRGWPLGVQLFGRDDLICVQQFLVKGLLKVDTELCTIEVRLTGCLQALARPSILSNSPKSWSSMVIEIHIKLYAQLNLLLQYHYVEASLPQAQQSISTDCINADSVHPKQLKGGAAYIEKASSQRFRCLWELPIILSPLQVLRCAAMTGNDVSRRPSCKDQAACEQQKHHRSQPGV